MITDDLYNKVLIEPITQGANKLYIVSGYASPAIVYKHLNDKDDFSVELLVGMVNSEGIRLGSHKTFVKLAKEVFPGRFTCKYNTNDKSIHVKAYGWYSGISPNKGFLGSANYTQMAFSDKQIEAMVECTAEPIKDIFNDLSLNSIDCLDPSVNETINFYDERKILTKKVRANGEIEHIETPVDKDIDISKFRESVTLSLLTGTGEAGDRSGINWGQRSKRNPNQAYIPVPARIKRIGFFPPKAQPFTVLTDDDKILECVIAQGGDKAIETYKDNSILGAYFRERIGVSSGTYVTKDDFTHYGRYDVNFYKIDDETYYMDFSVR